MSRYWSHPAVAAATWFLAFVGARIGLEATSFSVGTRILVAIIPSLPFAWFLSNLVRGMRELDELHRKVQLEALAIAYPILMLVLMTLGLLELAVELPAADLSYRHVFAFTPIIYFAALTATWRRYA
jgi:hypothetical protein